MNRGRIREGNERKGTNELTKDGSEGRDERERDVR